MRIVITGGSRGIGGMLAENLAGEHEVFVISKKATASKSNSKKIVSYAADVADEKAVQKVFNEIGGFDALVNCAGVLGPVGSFEGNELKLWKETITTNLFGTVVCTKLAIPFLKKRRNGKIVNFAGGGAAFPRVYHSAYASSKAAVVRFTENLAKDFEKDGASIDVNVIAPGAHKTGLWEQESFDKPPSEWADPKLVVKLVKFLLSSKSNGVSGKFIHVKDDYEKLAAGSGEDLFTLRRIDDRSFYKK